MANSFSRKKNKEFHVRQKRIFEKERKRERAKAALPSAVVAAAERGRLHFR